MIYMKKQAEVQPDFFYTVKSSRKKYEIIYLLLGSNTVVNTVLLLLLSDTEFREHIIKQIFIGDVTCYFTKIMQAPVDIQCQQVAG